MCDTRVVGAHPTTKECVRVVHEWWVRTRRPKSVCVWYTSGGCDGLEWCTSGGCAPDDQRVCACGTRVVGVVDWSGARVGGQCAQKHSERALWDLTFP
jgi:hypothetical protein